MSLRPSPKGSALCSRGGGLELYIAYSRDRAMIKMLIIALADLGKLLGL